MHISFDELNQYVDQELEASRAKEVELHLKSCEECNDQKQGLMRLVLEVKGLKEHLYDSASFERVWGEVKKELTKKQAKPETEPVAWMDWIRSFLLKPAMSAAFVVLLVFAAVFFSEQRSLASNEAVINSVSSEKDMVMIFKTEEFKVTVIWLLDQSDPSE